MLNKNFSYPHNFLVFLSFVLEFCFSLLNFSPCYIGIKTVAKIEISNFASENFSKIGPQTFPQNFLAPALRNLALASRNQKSQFVFEISSTTFGFCGLKLYLNIFLPMAYLNVSNCWSEVMLYLVY